MLRKFKKTPVRNFQSEEVKKAVFKRKSGLVFKKILTFCTIFFICFIFLGIIFTISLLHKKTILNPIVKVYSNVTNSFSDNTSSIENQLSKNNLPYKSVNKSSFGYTVVLKEGTIVYIDSSKDINSEISSLQLIQTHFTIEGKNIKLVDFRFDQPVVSF